MVLHAQVDAGARPAPNSEELAEIKRLKEDADLREASEILKTGGGRTNRWPIRAFRAAA